MSAVHQLKIQKKPYLDLLSGSKTGEVRDCSDRDFQVGDSVWLTLVDETGNPTGQSTSRMITHIQRGYGLPDEVCVLSYAPHPQPAAHLTIPGALEWDGDNGTHGVVGTHSADSSHSESAYDDAQEACAEIERAGTPGDVIREMNDELVDLRAQLDESNVVRQLIQAWASVHGRPVPWAKAIEITAVATKMPEDEKAALLALDDEPSSQYTAVDMTTAAADGFRDGLAAFSADGNRNVLAEVFFQKGDDPFICAVRGRICVEQLEAAQRDFRENLPDELEQGDGIYTFDFFYEKGQYDEFGRCEIAPGWGFDFVSYAAFEGGDDE